MNTNEVQNEVDARDEMRELTVEELGCVGGGSGGVIHIGQIIQPDFGGLIHSTP